ncbi:MAG: PAS-domain containing protein [Pseudomonadota bacterium]
MDNIDTAPQSAPQVASSEMRGLMQDVFDALEDGIALFDEQLRFVLANRRYGELVLPEGHPPLRPGETALDIGKRVFASGAYVLPAGTEPDALAEATVEVIRSYVRDLELERSDGRFLSAASKKTALGGYMITAKDITDRKRAEAVEAHKRAAVHDAIGALEEGVALIDRDMRVVLSNPRFLDLMQAPGWAAPDPDAPLRDLLETAGAAGHLTLPAGVDAASHAAALLSWLAGTGLPREQAIAGDRTLQMRVSKTELGGHLLMVSDLTEARNSEQRARDMLFDAFQSLDEGMVLCDGQMRFLFGNDAWHKMMFDRPDRIPPKPGQNVIENLIAHIRTGYYDIPPDMTEEDYTQWMMRGMAEHGKQVPYRTADGRHFIGSSHLTSFGGALLFIRDVTDRHNAEEKARDMLLEALQGLDEGLALYDQDMRFLYANRAWRKIFRFEDRPPSEFGVSAEAVFAEDVALGRFLVPEGSTAETYPDEVFDKIRGHVHDFPLDLANGRHLLGSSHETGLDGYLVSFSDVTEARKRDEKARMTFYDAIQALDISVALFDPAFRFVFANKAWHEMWFAGGTGPAPGAMPEEMVAVPLARDPDKEAAAAPPETFAAELYRIARAEVKDHAFHTRDGRIILGSSQKTDLGGYLFSFVDVTEQRRAEEKRLEAVNDALDATDFPMVLLDAEKRFVLANDAWFRMFGSKGRAPRPGEPAEEIFWRNINSGYYLLPEGVTKEDLHRKGLAFISTYGRDFPLTTADGKLFLGSSSKTALGGFLLSYRDITEQTRAEEALAEQREISHQNEKLSALGELLAGVAHELNNPLSVIFGYSQMLQGKVEEPILAERIDLICQSAERAAKIVRTFLAMARQRPMKIERCSINEVALTALEVCSYSLKSNGTEVVTELDAEVPAVSGDFDQLAQVLSNLIINAGHAVEPQRAGGRITLSSAYDADTDGTVLCVKDNGPGIPAEIQGRIFEPFFTTKDVGEGTGIGLAFSHRIVASHEGALNVRSTPEDGTCFSLRLKSAGRDADTLGASDPQTRARHVKTVLVVDDEAGVAQLVSDILTEEGLAVTTTTSPRHALHLVEGRSFDAVLSDFKMPDMDGEAFYKAMRVISPATARRMGFITGDAMSAHVQRFFATCQRPYIEKPIVRGELLSLLARSTESAEIDP